MSRLYDRMMRMGPGRIKCLDPAIADAVQQVAYTDLTKMALGNGRFEETDGQYGFVPDEPRRECVVIKADEVVRYAYQARIQDYVRDLLSNIAPPYWPCFVETRAPSYMLTSKGKLQGGMFTAWGAFINATDWAEDGSQDWREEAQEGIDTWLNEGAKELNLTIPYGVRWLLTGRIYGEARNGTIFLLGTFDIPVMEDGTQAIITPGQSDGYPIRAFATLGVFNTSPANMSEVAGSLRDDLIDPLLLSYTFMHCKNVPVLEVSPPEKLSRKSLKRYGIPLTKYRTIEIDGMKEVLRTEGRIQEVGLSKALHLCRGHFKTYTPEKPRFGRDTGSFWVSPHVRGSKDRGEVIKDYAVKAPR